MPQLIILDNKNKTKMLKLLIKFRQEVPEITVSLDFFNIFYFLKTTMIANEKNVKNIEVANYRCISDTTRIVYYMLYVLHYLFVSIGCNRSKTRYRLYQDYR